MLTDIEVFWLHNGVEIVILTDIGEFGLKGKYD